MKPPKYCGKLKDNEDRSSCIFSITFYVFSSLFFCLRRPQLADVKAQLRASDVANLQKQKVLLESLAKEYEVRVNRLKKILAAKRGYLKALQLDIQKYQRRNDDLISKLTDKLDNHQNLINNVLIDKVELEEINWKEKDMEVNEIN